MKARFCLISFDITRPMLPSAARRSFISKQQFSTLQEDYFCDIELDGRRYQIINRRSFCHHQLEGVVMMMVIDIKLKAEINDTEPRA